MEDILSGRNLCCGMLQRGCRFEQPKRGCSAYFQANSKVTLAPCFTYLTAWLLNCRLLFSLSVLFCSVSAFFFFLFFKDREHSITLIEIIPCYTKLSGNTQSLPCTEYILFPVFSAFLGVLFIPDWKKAIHSFL